MNLRAQATAIAIILLFALFLAALFGRPFVIGVLAIFLIVALSAADTFARRENGDDPYDS